MSLTPNNSKSCLTRTTEPQLGIHQLLRTECFIGRLHQTVAFQGTIFRSVDIDGGLPFKDENLRRTAPSGDIHTEVITAHCGDDDNKEGDVTMICDKFYERDNVQQI